MVAPRAGPGTPALREGVGWGRLDTYSESRGSAVIRHGHWDCGGWSTVGQQLGQRRPRSAPRAAAVADPRPVRRPARAGARPPSAVTAAISLANWVAKIIVRSFQPSFSTASAVRGRRGLAASSACGGRPRPSRRRSSIAATRLRTSGILTSTRSFLPQSEQAVVIQYGRVEDSAASSSAAGCHRAKLLPPPRGEGELGPGRYGHSRSRASSRPQRREAR